MWEWIYGTIILSFLAVFRQKLGVLLKSAVSYVFCSVELELGYTKPIEGYCKDFLKRSKIGNRTFSVGTIFVNPNNREEAVGYERFANSETVSVYWMGLFPFLVKYDFSSLSGGGKSISINYLKGTLDVDKLIIDTLEYFNNATFKNKEKNRYKLLKVNGINFQHVEGEESGERRQGNVNSFMENKEKINPLTDCEHKKFLKWELSDLVLKHSLPSSSLADLSLSKEVLDAVEEAKRWKNSQDWYKDRRIPWKRGWVLHGLPGTGKTSLSRALALELKIPLIIFNLSQVDDRLLQAHWENSIPKESPCIVLMEDIDTIFKKRTPKENVTLSMETLLNCLDGAIPCEGVFVILTTNNMEELDPALGGPDDAGKYAEMGNRPGRIDRMLKLNPLDKTGRDKLARRVLKGYPEHFQETVNKGDGDTGAQFQERCSRLALDLYWTEKEQSGVLSD